MVGALPRGLDTGTCRPGLTKDVFPYIGTQPTNTITAPAMLSVIQRIEERGAVETGHRLRQTCDVIFAYAIATGRCDNNPAAAIKKAMQPVTGRRHYARLKDPSDIGELLRGIEGYRGTHIVRCALRLMPLTFTCPCELCQAEWANINLDRAMWTVPAEVKKQAAPLQAGRGDPARPATAHRRRPLRVPQRTEGRRAHDHRRPAQRPAAHRLRARDDDHPRL